MGINDRNILVLAVLCPGMYYWAVALQLINFLVFKNYHGLTLSLLSGFLIGSSIKSGPGKKSLPTEYPAAVYKSPIDLKTSSSRFTLLRPEKNQLF